MIEYGKKAQLRLKVVYLTRQCSLHKIYLQNFRNPFKHFNYCNDFKWRQKMHFNQETD